MVPAASEVVPQVASTPGFAFNLLPASVLVAIITQAWITCREKNERVRRRQAALAAIESEFEVIVTSLNDFWEKVQKAWEEGSKDALVRFCTIPYPEGALAAWASSLRTLLPMLPADQIREKIEWLYVIETMNTLRKSLVGDYERFCIYEQSSDMSNGEEIRNMTFRQANWVETTTPRLIEFKNKKERLQCITSDLLSGLCRSI